MFPGFRAGTVTMDQIINSLGSFVPGTLRQFGAFKEDDIVELLNFLSYREAATLPCAALTAWSSIYGAQLPLRPGQTVVTEGTGGVSVFAVQFAKAGGAQVIATTSSAAKEAKLKGLGVDHVINYKQDPQWGVTAKKLSLGGRGADIVVDIGGNKTLEQAVKAAVIQSEIAVVGGRADAGTKEKESHQGIQIHMSLARFRQVILGSRIRFEEMNRAIEVNGIHPVLDERTFGFADVPEPYEYFSKGQHFGKVVIDINWVDI